MKLVIDIPEKVLQRIQSVANGSWGRKNLDDLELAILDGTILPKGHGRLIDASQLLTVTECREDGTEYSYVPYTYIEDEPTIIEADKDGEQ